MSRRASRKPCQCNRVFLRFQSVEDDAIVVAVWYVYILRCSNNSLYIGETNDVAQRVADHQRGRGSELTTKFRPVHLVYCEQHPHRAAALKRERQLKGWTRAKKDALIQGDRNALRNSIRCQRGTPLFAKQLRRSLEKH